MLADLVSEYIRTLCASGETQKQLAETLHLDQSTLNRIISGKRKVEFLTIGTFDKMFPQAQISLTGGPVTIGPAVTGDRNTVTGVNNFFSPSGGAAAAPPEVTAVLSSPLPPSEKAAILRALYHPAESEVQK